MQWIRLCAFRDRGKPSLLVTFVALEISESIFTVRKEALRPLCPIRSLFVVHSHLPGRVS